jgi:hypothetical protein
MACGRRSVAELHRLPQEKKSRLMLCEFLLLGEIQRSASEPTELDGTVAVAGGRRR